MPVNEKRIFRCREHWWNAVVVSSSGLADDLGIRRMNQEEVVFTCLTEKHEKSRRIYINPGFLNKMNHHAICEMLSNSNVLQERHDYSIGVIPVDENSSGIGYADETGVRWLLVNSTISRIESVGKCRRIPAVLVYCLDDSAITGKVGLKDEFTFSSFYESYGKNACKEIVGVVEKDYFEYKDSISSKENKRKVRAEMTRRLREDPIGAMLERMDVRYGSEKLVGSTSTIFAIRAINYKGKKLPVEAGIHNGKVYAATKGRNEIVEMAIIAAIENNPEHVFVYQEYQKCLAKIERRATALEDKLD